MEHLLSLGGMCWVRKMLEELWPDLVGEYGPFDYTATIPSIVLHSLQDDFQQFLSPGHFKLARGKKNGPVRHEFYEQRARDALWEIVGSDKKLGDFVRMFIHNPVVPPMFMHPGTKGIDGLIDDLRRRAQRVRQFLDKDTWKVMVWGVAIPYSIYYILCS